MYLRVVLTGTAKDSLFNSFILRRLLQEELAAQTCNSSHVLNQQWEDKKKKPFRGYDSYNIGSTCKNFFLEIHKQCAPETLK